MSPRPQKYSRKMKKFLANIEEADYEILRRNANEDQNVTEMIQRAVKLFILQHGLK